MGLLEVFGFRKGQGSWEVVPDPRGDPPGFDTHRPGAASRHDRKGRSKYDVWSALQMRKAFEPAQVRDGTAPQGLTPKSVVDALFGKTIPGLAVAPGTREAVVKLAGRLIAKHFQGSFDAVVPMHSKKGVSAELARAVGEAAGIPVIDDAILKQLDPLGVDVDWDQVTDPEERKSMEGNLERAWRAIQATGSFSIRKTFAPRQRHLVRGLSTAGPGASRHTEFPRVLLVDDLVLTGTTLLDARRTLLQAGFREVQMACLFKAQEN